MADIWKAEKNPHIDEPSGSYEERRTGLVGKIARFQKLHVFAQSTSVLTWDLRIFGGGKKDRRPLCWTTYKKSQGEKELQEWTTCTHYHIIPTLWLSRFGFQVAQVGGVLDFWSEDD